MAGSWSHPGDFSLPEEEEDSDGDMNMIGPGRSSGFGVDGDTHMFGPGRSPGLGHTDEESNMLGLHRSSQFGTFNEQNFNSHAITSFHAEGMQGGLGSSAPISMNWKYKTCR